MKQLHPAIRNRVAGALVEKFKMARVTGLEPATSGVTGQLKSKSSLTAVSTSTDPDQRAFYSKVETDFGALPVGGSTGLCHQSTSAIEIAAAWYRQHFDDCEQPIIPALRRRFGLSPLEAIMALREARGRLS